MNMFAKLSMKFEAQLQRFAIRGIVGLIALLFSVPGWSAQAQGAAGAPALTNWQAALASFQKIGALIGEGKYAPAKLELRSGATNLPPPYRVMAAQYLEQLEGALQHSSGKKDHRQLSALLELSAELRAYPAALQLITRLRKASREDEEPQSHSLAWLLLENGQTKAALAQYERKLAQEHIEIWQSHCRKQMELIGQRPANMTNVQFALEYVREHYLKGYEEKADHLSALKELTRILGCARNSQASLAVLHLMMKCFSALDDQAGLEAWEDKVLTDFKSDRDACAGVYLDRGLRAYGRKNLSEALDFFRKICAGRRDLGPDRNSKRLPGLGASYWKWNPTLPAKSSSAASSKCGLGPCPICHWQMPSNTRADTNDDIHRYGNPRRRTARKASRTSAVRCGSETVCGLRYRCSRPCGNVRHTNRFLQSASGRGSRIDF